MLNVNFTKKKFLKLDTKKKHKEIASLIRLLYERLLLKQYVQNIYHELNQLLTWIGENPFNSQDLKEISNKYHFHLSKAEITLKEHNLLPSLTHIDGNNEQRPFLKNAIYLDNLRSAFNVGNIIRTSEALRIGSIYFSVNTPFIDNEKVKKTSMGSYQLTKCYKEFNIKDLPRPFIGLDTSKNSKSIYDFIFPNEFTLILGNEEIGISDQMLHEIDYLIEIPMLGFKNSINVASAFAICASEINRTLAISKI